MNKLAKAEKLFDLIAKLPTSVVSELNATVNKAIDAMVTIEGEKSRRAEIEAHRDVAIRDIDARREVLDRFLFLTFQERQGVLDAHLVAVEKAMASGRDDQVTAALGSMVELVRTSPLLAVGNIRAALASDTKLSLE